jgi:NadR type nicotinamide-nucleotide adenylyltransferase
MRFAITGPESSGKTTLAKELAFRNNGVWIPEFAREYLESLPHSYTVNDLDHIAKGQLKLWQESESNTHTFFDTEMLVMKIWSEFKYQKCSPFILSALEQQSFDHYFLCRPDIEWEEDPLREHPEKREELFELYLNELTSRKLPFTIVEGDLENRIENCQLIISELKAIQ